MKRSRFPWKSMTTLYIACAQLAGVTVDKLGANMNLDENMSSIIAPLCLFCRVSFIEPHILEKLWLNSVGKTSGEQTTKWKLLTLCLLASGLCLCHSVFD